MNHLGSTEASALAERMILASLTGDGDGQTIAESEVPDCTHCWREIARHLAWAAAWFSHFDRGRHRAIGFTSDVLLSTLDRAARLRDG